MDNNMKGGKDPRKEQGGRRERKREKEKNRRKEGRKKEKREGERERGGGRRGEGRGVTLGLHSIICHLDSHEPIPFLNSLFLCLGQPIQHKYNH